MVARVIRRLLGKKPAPKAPLMLPAPVIVRAAVSTAGAGKIGPKTPPGMLDMAEVMAAAGEAARQEGVTSDDAIRERKLLAREVLKNARAQAIREGQPVEFTVGTYTATVTPG